MKQLQSWVDLWAPNSGKARPVFVGQMKAMLLEVIMEIEVKAARNSTAAGTTMGSHHLAIEQTLKEIEDLK